MESGIVYIAKSPPSSLGSGGGGGGTEPRHFLSVGQGSARVVTFPSSPPKCKQQPSHDKFGFSCYDMTSSSFLSSLCPKGNSVPPFKSPAVRFPTTQKPNSFFSRSSGTTSFLFFFENSFLSSTISLCCALLLVGSENEAKLFHHNKQATTVKKFCFSGRPPPPPPRFCMLLRRSDVLGRVEGAI